MYQHFFGFKEKPFQQVPNPAYLFLSRLHEEALAHLVYAVSNGDGFVRITGEVGTGKTTLCRAFLENLNENTEAAYILNPKLDAVQLLRAINEEFGIPADADNIKDLIDTLNRFLISEKTKGRHVVLLIDEAQNLAVEVLEQIRLLSNLETTRSKLLQIILVGQPELDSMLGSPELRQLGQRITLSCSLSPLTLTETGDYIRHRLQIASRKPGIRFPRSAVKAVYRYSRGIPRLINIACDRTLLTAYGMGRRRITGKITRAAVKEIADKHRFRVFSLLAWNRKIYLLSALCLALLISIRYMPDGLDFSTLLSLKKIDSGASVRIKIPPQTNVGVSPAPAQISAPVPSDIPITPAPDPETAPPEKVALATAASETDKAKHSLTFEPTPLTESEKSTATAIPVEDLGTWLKETAGQVTRNDAIQAVLDLWKTDAGITSHLNAVEDDVTFFQMALLHNGLSYLNASGDLALIRKLDLPAVIELFIPNGTSTAYLTISKMVGKHVTLSTARSTPIVTTIHEVKTYWSGMAFIPWKNFFSFIGQIPEYASKESLYTFKMMLKDIGFSGIQLNAEYDEAARHAIKTLQSKYGVAADGVVGPLTKIILYNELGSLYIPRISGKERNPS